MALPVEPAGYPASGGGLGSERAIDLESPRLMATNGSCAAVHIFSDRS